MLAVSFPKISPHPFLHKNFTFLHFASPNCFDYNLQYSLIQKKKKFRGAVISHTSIYLFAVSKSSRAEREGWRECKGQASVPSFLRSPSFLTEIKPIKQTGALSVHRDGQYLCVGVCVCVLGNRGAVCYTG